MTDYNLPSPEEVVVIHDKIEERYDLKYTGAMKHPPKLYIREILKQAAKSENVYLCAAILLRDFVTTHIFEDGNKRTAWLTMLEFLSREGIVPPRNPDPDCVLKRIRRFEYEELAQWIESGQIDEARLD